MLESQVSDLRLVIHVFDLTLKSTAIETFPGVIEDLDYEYKNHQIWDFFLSSEIKSIKNQIFTDGDVA